MLSNIRRYAVLALSIMGSATLLLSCGSKSEPLLYDNETLMTESSENRTITMMENGKRSYTFTTPLMEGYRLAANPYQEFRRGIEMTTYTDSLSLPEVTITANYAIYYERQKLWEAKGNVVVIRRDRKDGDTTVTGLTEVYTQQLFWNATTEKIYSNVDTKVLQGDGWHFGVGFDADDDLKNIHFRKYSSEMEFDMSQQEQKPAADSTNTQKRDIRKIKENEEKEQKAKEQESKHKDRDNGGIDWRSRATGVNKPSIAGQVVRPTDVNSSQPMSLENSAFPATPSAEKRGGQISGLKSRRDKNSESPAVDKEVSLNLSKQKPAN
jgi:LPS export ABC transporter protein LptC